MHGSVYSAKCVIHKRHNISTHVVFAFSLGSRRAVVTPRFSNDFGRTASSAVVNTQRLCSPPNEYHHTWTQTWSSSSTTIITKSFRKWLFEFTLLTKFTKIVFTSSSSTVAIYGDAQPRIVFSPIAFRK